MGALEIRRSSANVQSLGQFRMPELDDGSSKAFEAQANAAKSVMQSVGVAGHAAIDGISRRGQIVARTLKGLGELALEIVDRENERVATNAVLASEKERNAFMYGDGTPENPGQFNVEFDAEGAEKWLAGLKDEHEKRTQKYLKDLNPAQRRIYEEAMAKKEVEWQLRIGSHAAKKSFEYQIVSSVADTKSALDEACAKFADPNARDGAIQAYYGKVEKEFATRGLPESQRGVFFRNATQNLLAEMPKYTFSKWVAETADNDDPKAVKAAWDEHRKLLDQTGGKAPMNPLIRKYLGSDQLADDQVKFIRAHFEESADKAVDRAKSLRLTHIKEDMQSFADETAALRADQLDPAKADKVQFNVHEFRMKLDRNTRLDPSAKAKLMEDYRAAYDYQQKYVVEKKKYLEAASEDQRAKFGYEQDDGKGGKIFVPASSFIDPKDMKQDVVTDFGDDSLIWQGDLTEARARVEAARMTGRFSRAYYENRIEFLKAKHKEGFDERWAQVFPMIEDLKRAGYGKRTEDLTPSEKKFRKDRGGKFPIAIWAKKSGSKQNGTIETFIADSLTHTPDEDATEEFIDLATMGKLYRTCAALEVKGVPLLESARQIIAPSIAEAVGRRLNERLGDADYLETLASKYAGEHGYADNVERAVTKERLKQGRISLDKQDKDDENWGK